MKNIRFVKPGHFLIIAGSALFAMWLLTGCGPDEELFDKLEAEGRIKRAEKKAARAEARKARMEKMQSSGHAFTPAHDTVAGSTPPPELPREEYRHKTDTQEHNTATDSTPPPESPREEYRHKTDTQEHNTVNGSTPPPESPSTERQREKRQQKPIDPSQEDISIRLAKGIRLKMIRIRAGEYLVGPPHREHTVYITQDYFLAETELTLEQYYFIKDKKLYSADESMRMIPLTGITLKDAEEICHDLNRLNIVSPEWKFAIPTEVQWEIAAREGHKKSNFKYSGSNNYDDVAVTGNISPVKNKQPNALGFYDMSGNAFEICLDRINLRKYTPNLRDRHSVFISGYTWPDLIDPLESSGPDSVYRGGSCKLQCTIHDRMVHIERMVGLRLALVLESPDDEKVVQAQQSIKNRKNQDPDKLQELAIILPNRSVLEMVRIPVPDKTVKVGDQQVQECFFISKSNITNGQFRAIAGKELRRAGMAPLKDDFGLGYAYSGLSSIGQTYCNMLNSRGLAPHGWEFAVPTEDQYKLAADSIQTIPIAIQNDPGKPLWIVLQRKTSN